MRILNIIQCTNLGGMEQAALDSIALLRDAGHEVLMLSMHPVGDLKELAAQEGIPLEGSAGYRLFGLGNVPWLLKKIRAYKPDRILITGHNFGSIIAARLSGNPGYLSLHYHHGAPLSKGWKLFYRCARNMCQRFHFVTRYIYDEVASELDGVENIACFPNMFRDEGEELEQDDARKILEIDSNAFWVGNAGWLIHRKAFDVFLETAALVHQKCPEARFIIAGDGEERDRLQAQAEKLGVADYVIFCGWLQDLRPFYRALDVLLFNSRFDALGRTPIEALCHGIPIVASVTNGGLHEFIRHGTDGYLIDNHNVEAMASEIIHLYNDPEYRQKIAAAGKARALEIGSPERHLEKWEEFLELK